MKNPTEKQLKRQEKKTKKMAAFLEIAKLNDKDKEAKLQALKQVGILKSKNNKMRFMLVVCHDNFLVRSSHWWLQQ